MQNIGVDLGTTYSMMASYDSINDRVEEFKPSEMSSVHIPSIVCYDKKLGRFKFGEDARVNVGSGTEKYQIFQAFKMLLPENNEELLACRGYDREHTPQKITQTFLEHYLKLALNQRKISRFGKMVVCVPEIWNGSGNTLDGRKKMRNLCNAMNVAEKVHIVTEPEAASAYFVYNYQKAKKKPFDGYVLTVDYGGGTLDITLNKVSTEVQGKKYITKLRSLTRAGKGENFQRTIGAAGVAYMEGVVILAMRDAGILREEERPEHNAEFQRAVMEVERTLQSQEVDIKNTFSMNNYDLELIQKDLGEEALEFLSFRDQEIPFTYGHLAKAYQQIIEPVLEEALDSIIKRANSLSNQERVDLSKPRADVLYAIVGGFGKFALVEQQVYKKLGLTNTGQFLQNPIYQKRESAVAMGAALIAEGIVDILPIAGQSWGIWGTNYTSKGYTYTVNYGIKYGQEIRPNEINYIYCGDNCEKIEDRVIYTFGDGRIASFIIGFDDDFKAGTPMTLRPVFLERMSNLGAGRHYIGFAQDEDGIITVYIQKADSKNKEECHPLGISLSTFQEMFEITDAKIIRHGEVKRDEI